jgi:hypothetical protein
VTDKVMWTRADGNNGHFRSISAHDLRAGLANSGKLRAWCGRSVQFLRTVKRMSDLPNISVKLIDS